MTGNIENPQPQTQSESFSAGTTSTPFWERTLNRRQVGKIVVGLGVTLAVARLSPTHPESALADGGEPTPTPRPEADKRYELLKNIEPATFSFDPELGDLRRNTPILGLEISPYPQEMSGLTPENPFDRLDLAFFKMSGVLYKNRGDFRSFAKGKLPDSQLFDSSNPLIARAQNGELPPTISDSGFADLIEKKPDLMIPIWGYDSDSITGMDMRLLKFNPRKGMEVKLLKKGVKNWIMGSDAKPGLGSLIEVKDDKLQLGIYGFDMDFASLPYVGDGQPYSLSRFTDFTYSSLILGEIMERSMLFAGRYDIQQEYDEAYLQNRNNTPGTLLFPGMAELLGGGITAKDPPIFASAPILHIISPNINSSKR